MCERELETEHNCNILTPHSYGRQRCVFLVLLAYSTTSCLLTHLISNSSGPQLIRAPSAPSAWCGFPYHILSATPTDLSDFLPTQSPTWSLEWHVWSSSSGNNCYAVQRSLSSGVSVYECIMGFLPCPILSAKSAYAISFDYWPLGCVSSFRCIPLEWHDWPGRRSKYNTQTNQKADFFYGKKLQVLWQPKKKSW